MTDSTDRRSDLPREAAHLIAQANKMVTDALGVAPDLTPETLPLLDGFLRTTAEDLPRSEREKLIDAIGCYFGEVARRKLDGRWTVVGSTPHDWRIELTSCFLHFSPVGMVGEVLIRCESEDYDGTFSTLDQVRPDLEAMLNAAPPLSEDEYYSTSGRLETLTLVADWLVGQHLAAGRKPRSYSAEDYRAQLDHH